MADVPFGVRVEVSGRVLRRRVRRKQGLVTLEWETPNLGHLDDPYARRVTNLYGRSPSDDVTVLAEGEPAIEYRWGLPDTRVDVVRLPYSGVGLVVGRTHRQAGYTCPGDYGRTWHERGRVAVVVVAVETDGTPTLIEALPGDVAVLAEVAGG